MTISSSFPLFKATRLPSNYLGKCSAFFLMIDLFAGDIYSIILIVGNTANRDRKAGAAVSYEPTIIAVS